MFSTIRTRATNVVLARFKSTATKKPLTATQLKKKEKPKKAPTARNFYVGEFVKSNYKPNIEEFSVKNLFKLANDRFDSLSSGERAKYDQLHSEAKEKYATALKAWEEKYPKRKPNAYSSFVKANWNGVYDGEGNGDFTTTVSLLAKKWSNLTQSEKDNYK